MVHEIKCHPAPFAELKRGTKTFETRFNDRNYQPGDRLVIHEYDAVTETYTGEKLAFDTHFVSCWHVEDGYIILALNPVTDGEKEGSEEARP